MGGIDISDMMLSYVECVRKTVKWHKKLFFHLLDLTLLNSYICYQIITGEKQGLPKFQLELSRQLLQKYGTEKSFSPGAKSSLESKDPARLTGNHFPEYIPANDKNANPSKCCVHHGKQKIRKETRFQCETCQVALCPVPCMKSYHTQ